MRCGAGAGFGTNLPIPQLSRAYYLPMVAVLTGNAAAADHWEKSEVSGVLSTHEDWATGTLLCGLLVVLGRLPLQLKGDAGQRRWALWTAGSVAAGVLVLATAYYGGVLVYEYGVGVQVGG